MELQDVTCTLGDGVPVEVGTFANAQGDGEDAGIGGGLLMSHDPDYPGRPRIEGDLWAATVDFNKLKAEVGYYSAMDPTAVDFSVITSALGGRQVNSPAWSR